MDPGEVGIRTEEALCTALEAKGLKRQPLESEIAKALARRLHVAYIPDDYYLFTWEGICALVSMSVGRRRKSDSEWYTSISFRTFPPKGLDKSYAFGLDGIRPDITDTAERIMDILAMIPRTHTKQEGVPGSAKLVGGGAYIEISFPVDDFDQEGGTTFLKVLHARPERLEAAYGTITTDDGRRFGRGLLPVRPKGHNAGGGAVAWPLEEEA